MVKIADLMVSEMVTVAPTDTVAEATRRMAQNRVGAVLLVDGTRLDGLFSERDLATRVVAAGKDPATTAVRDVATRDVVTVATGDGVRVALDAFRRGRFRHLPVLDGGQPAGILSTRDLLAHAVEALEAYLSQAGYDRDTAAGVDPYDHFGGSYGK